MKRRILGIAAIGLSAAIILAGCIGSSKKKTASSPAKKAAAEETESKKTEQKERNGYDEGTTDYTVGDLIIHVPNYFSLSNDHSTDDDMIWYAESGNGSVAMLEFQKSDSGSVLDESTINQLKGTAPSQIVSGMNSDNLHFDTTDIADKKDLTVAGYPSVSFDITGTSNFENSDAKTSYFKYVIIFIPGSSNAYIAGLGQSDNTKYSYIGDFDKFIDNITAAQPSNNSSSDSAAAASGQVTPELKSFLDSYEAFVDQYVELAKKYQANPSDLNLLSEYSDYLTKLSDFEKQANAYDQSESTMSTADYNYYIDSMARIQKKLLAASSELSGTSNQ